MAWRDEVVTVSLVSPYAAMVRVVAVAADFVRSHDPHISGIDEDLRDNLQVKHCLSVYLRFSPAYYRRVVARLVR